MSSRKRTSKKPTETSTIADPPSTETSTAVAEPTVVEAPAGVAEQSAAATDGDGRTFADRVGQKKWQAAPDPFGIAKDNLAGVRLFDSQQDEQMAIKFGDGGPDAKPSQAVRDRMREAGWQWKPADRIWALPYRPNTVMSTRIEAEQLYQEVRQMIREEKGIGAEHEQGVPF